MLALLLLQLLMNVTAAKLWPETPCPVSIKKVIWNGGQRYNPELDQVYQTLTRCANPGNASVRTLHLNIQQSGCVINPEDKWNFDFRPGDKFPSLHELHLDGYLFREFPRSHFGQWEFKNYMYHFWRWVADFTGVDLFQPTPEISGYDYRSANLEKWKAAMDWRELRDLDLEDVDAIFLRSMQGQLPGLESLRLGSLWSETCLENNVTDFIIQLNPLSRLSLRGHTNKMNLTEILDRHGAALETLEIHEWEGDHFLRPTLSRAELEQIRQKCPSLSKLSLDINRNGTWPFDLLYPLAANRNLSSLELFFELGMNEHQREHEYELIGESFSKSRLFRKPLVNKTSSLCLFERLRSLKQGVALQHLKLVVGDAGREYSHMLRSPAWGESLAEVYECGVLDSGGDAEGDGQVWCEQRSTGRNIQEQMEDDQDDTLEEELRQMEEEELRKVQAQFEL